MSTEPVKVTNFHRPCPNPACGAAVHRNSKRCSACGGPSPWHPEQAPTPAPNDYICTKGFGLMIGISLRTFESGERITDPSIIQLLLEQGLPIKPRGPDDRVVTCPHCHKTYLPEPEVPAEYSPEMKARLERMGLSTDPASA